MKLERFAAFSVENGGGNPAGVVLTERKPHAMVMQDMAARVGYSETVFASPDINGWKVRYFAPEMEVPFCGHATIALGGALAKHYGSGVYKLTLKDNNITVEGRSDGNELTAAFQSPPTRTECLPVGLLDSALSLMSLSPDELDTRIPPRIAIAGARHLVLTLSSRESLRSMSYDLAGGRTLMNQARLTTIMLVYSRSSESFDVRNAFASGGVYEDPATGAAAAAFAGYLRELQWPHGGNIDITQGEDMGSPSRIFAEIPKMLGVSIRISGQVRVLAD